MVEARDVSVAFGDGCAAALSDVNLTLRCGELVAVVGPNGSGKSTLGSLLCGMRLPSSGSVSVDGHDASASDEERRCVCSLVGMVRQDPRDQIVSSRVVDEIAFGPRNLGLDEETVRARVREAIALTGLAGFEDRDTTGLSGGEQQRLALAGVLAMHSRYVVLDEATSQLDSAARPSLRCLFDRLAHEEGLGVVQITHDPLEIMGSDRVIALDHGGIAWEGTPRELLAVDELADALLPVNDGFIAGIRVALQAGFDFTCSVTPAALQSWFESPQGASARAAVCERFVAPGSMPTGSLSMHGMRSLELRDVCFSYGEGDGARPVLERVTLSVTCGRSLLLAGRSGEGKSTLAMIAAGLLEPSSGSVLFDGKPVRPGGCSLAFQEPESQFFLDAVFDEIAFAPRNLGLDATEIDARVERARSLVGLPSDLLDRYPFELSGGQARRVALASALTLSAGVCILDEPSAGLDADGRAFARDLVRKLADEGMAVIVISHDLDEWLDAVDEVALLGDGRIVWNGSSAACKREPAVFERCGLIAPFLVRLAAGAAVGGSEGAHVAVSAPTDRSFSVGGGREAFPVASRAASVLSQLDARVKIITLLALTVCVFLSHQPATLAVWLVVAALIVQGSGMTVRSVARSLRPVAIVLAFALCANLVSCDGGAAVPLVGPVGLNPAGGLRGLVAVARIVVLVGCSVSVAASTAPTEVSDAVMRLLRPLGKVGLPIGAVGTVLSIALRFMPLVGEELKRIQTAQRARGARFDEGPVIRRIQVWASVLTPLIVGLFRRADRLADAMSARCYAGARSVQVPSCPLAAKDRAVLALVALVTATTVMFSLKGWI